MQDEKTHNWFKLDIKVKGEAFEWKLIKTHDNGSDKDVNTNEKGYGNINLSMLRKQTIESLINMFYLLTNIVQNHARQLDSITTSHLLRELSTLTRVLGAELFSVLIDDEMRSKLCDKAVDDNRVRVILEFNKLADRSILSWPWEYMYAPMSKNRDTLSEKFISHRAELSIIRNLGINPGRELKTSLPIKVFVVVANPPLPVRESLKLSAVYGERVIEQLKKVINNGRKVFKVETLEVPEYDDLEEKYNAKVTITNFKQKIAEFNPHIIHFIGHGKRISDFDDGKLLYFKNNGKQADWISADQFANAIKGCNALKLVFLQACESILPEPNLDISDLAEKILIEHVPAVIGMQYRIEQASAGIFAEAFYRALAQGEWIDIAVQTGRDELLSQTDAVGSFAIPVVYLHKYDRMVNFDSLTSSGAPVLENTYICPNCERMYSTTPPRFCGGCGFQFSSCRGTDPETGELCGQHWTSSANFCENCGAPKAMQMPPDDSKSRLSSNPKPENIPPQKQLS